MSVSLPPHNLLSVFHLDALAASVIRGDLVIGNSTPKWSRLAIGSANALLSSDGTDISWATATGTGFPVRATSPTLTTPILGVASGTSLTLSGLTLGSVLFASTSGLISQDNINLFWDDTNDRLGLGTNSPATALHVVNDAATTVRINAYVSNTAGAELQLQKARGSIAAPRRAQLSDQLANITVYGAEAADDVTTASFGSSSGRIAFYTNEAFTSSAHGTEFDISLAAIGSVTLVTRLSLDETHFRWFASSRTNDTAGVYALPYSNSNYGTNQNQVLLQLIAQVDKSGGTPTYGAEPAIIWSVYNESATPSLRQAFAMGYQSKYNNSSVIDAAYDSLYIYDMQRVLTMMSFPPLGANTLAAGTAPASFPDIGVTINSVSGDYGTANSYAAGKLTVNNSDTGSYWGLRIRPNLNPGSSNLNKTVYIADFDSTIVTSTGLTVYPLRLGYGGTQLAIMNSTGQLGLGISTPTQVLHVVAQAGSNTSANFDQYSSNATGPSIRGRKARNTLADPRRANTDDVLFSVNTVGFLAADDSTAATAGGDVGQFRFRAAENFTSSAQGSYFELRVTPVGSLAASIITAIRVNGTGNVKIAGSAVRGTTEGTNHLDIFDGTAPAGTLTNGISLYSTSGELRVMDSAGNATLLSPHDKVTNEWIFDSVDINGKRLRIEVEKMLRYLNKILNTDFVSEVAA